MIIDIDSDYVFNVMNLTMDEFIEFQNKLIYISIAMGEAEFALIDAEELLIEEEPKTEIEDFYYTID